jgi:hypothetical protein
MYHAGQRSLDATDLPLYPDCVGTEFFPDHRGSETSHFTWVDPAEVEWSVVIGWTETAPQIVEATQLSLDSHGARPITSAVLRSFEAELRRRREERKDAISQAAETRREDDWPERAKRQVAAYVADLELDAGRRKRGRRTDHEKQLYRVLAMWRAKRDRPRGGQLAALRDHLKEENPKLDLKDGEAARAYARRARAWDRASGLHMLTGDPKDDDVVRAAHVAKAIGRRAKT